MTAPEKIWVGIRGVSLHNADLRDVHYTRTDTIFSPLDDPRVVALVGAMIAVAEQSTRDEIPEGYGPEHIEGFDDGYDAAIMKCRAALSAITKEPKDER